MTTLTIELDNKRLTCIYTAGIPATHLDPECPPEVEINAGVDNSSHVRLLSEGEVLVLSQNDEFMARLLEAVEDKMNYQEDER